MRDRFHRGVIILPVIDRRPSLRSGSHPDEPGTMLLLMWLLATSSRADLFCYYTYMLYVITSYDATFPSLGDSSEKTLGEDASHVTDHYGKPR